MSKSSEVVSEMEESVEFDDVIEVTDNTVITNRHHLTLNITIKPLLVNKTNRN